MKKADMIEVIKNRAADAWEDLNFTEYLVALELEVGCGRDALNAALDHHDGYNRALAKWAELNELCKAFGIDYTADDLGKQASHYSNQTFKRIREV